MEIRIIIDDRIVRAVRRVLGRPLLAAAAGLVTLIGGVGVVSGVGVLNTFTPNTPISASEVNANFEVLRAAVGALETKPSPFAGCTTNYSPSCGANVDCVATCALGQVPISGGCDTAGEGVMVESYPTAPNGDLVNGSVSELGRWVCRTDMGTVWAFAVCCTP